MITIAVVVFLAIILLVFLILAARAWKALHITLLFLVFIAMTFGLMLMSKTVRTRNAWQNQHHVNLEKVAETKAAYDLAVYGKSDAIALDENSLVGVSMLLEKQRTGRGRVWNNVRADDGGTDQEVKLNVLKSDGTASTTTSLKPDMILYAFKNKLRALEGREESVLISESYIGNIKIVSVAADGTATGEALFIADAEVFNDKLSQTWALYEQMPTDSHDAFRDASGIVENPSDLTDVDAYLTKYRAALKTYMPKTMIGIEGDDEYESFIDQFAFDGMREDQIKDWLSQNGNRAFDPDPNQLYDVFKFNDSTNKNQFDGFQVNNTTANIKEEDQFDNNGYAVDPALKLPEDRVHFQTDNEIVIDQRSAQDGIKNENQVVIKAPFQDNNVTRMYTLYKRELLDYPYLLRKLRESANDLVEQEARLSANNSQAQLSIENLKKQTNNRTAKISNLKTDNQNLSEDLASIQELLKQRSLELEQRQLRINALYLDISEKHEALKLASEEIMGN